MSSVATWTWHSLSLSMKREVKIKDVASMCIASKGYKWCPHKMSRATLVRRREKKIGIDSMAILSPLIFLTFSSLFSSILLNRGLPLCSICWVILSRIMNKLIKIVCYFTNYYYLFQGKRKRGATISNFTERVQKYFILRAKNLTAKLWSARLSAVTRIKLLLISSIIIAARHALFYGNFQFINDA